MQKDFLREIACGVVRNAGEQDRVDVTREARVQLAECVAISRLCGPNDRRVIGQRLPILSVTRVTAS